MRGTVLHHPRNVVDGLLHGACVVNAIREAGEEHGVSPQIATGRTDALTRALPHVNDHVAEISHDWAVFPQRVADLRNCRPTTRQPE